MEKRCFRCLRVLPLDDFYRHDRMSDGRLNKCKGCTKADAREHRLANIERVRAYDRLRASAPHRVALRDKIVKKWAATFPDRKRAQTAVGNALRDGRLVRWPVCSVPECDKKPEAHHPNYETPLDVVWLCRAHHKQAHALTAETV